MPSNDEVRLLDFDMQGPVWTVLKFAAHPSNMYTTNGEIHSWYEKQKKMEQISLGGSAFPC